MKKASDYKKGDGVLYVPTHAQGNTKHPDCERGVVSSVNVERNTVWVKYDNAMCMMITGDEPYTAKSTRVEDLVP